jgi:hypothetical protein
MLLVVTLHPTGKIDLNSAEVEMTGRALKVLRESLGECAQAIVSDPANKLVRLAEMIEDGQTDHRALRAIGFTKIAVVVELEQPVPTAAELLLRNQPS